MDDFALFPVLAGAAAFFAVSLIWYGVMFRSALRDQRSGGRLEAAPVRPGALLLALAFAFEMLVAMVLWHLVARTDPAPFVVMMMAIGFAVGVMIPAIGIAALVERRSGVLFAIDAGQLIVGMAAMGGTFVLLR